VNVFLDTSVLVPVFIADHEHHDASMGLFRRLGGRSSCAAHSLAEVYSTVTRMPGKYRASADHAMLFLAEIRSRLNVVALNETEYYNALQNAADRGVMGGTIYDALIVRCAAKAKAGIIYTWNIKHFQQINFAGRIRTP
jgi:predicted nucleic acid-binding protein